MNDIHYANIGIALGLTVAIAGALIFGPSNEAAMQASGLIGFLVGIFTIVLLVDRAQRRREKRQ
jgi:hypothetical protein